MNTRKWQRKRIGELFDVQLGKMLNEKAKEGTLFPYLANFNVRWGSFDLSTLNEMSFSKSEREKYSLIFGDLLMCEGGEIGRCAVWKNTKESIFYQKAIHRLRPLTEDISSLFVYYYMQHISTKGELPKLVGETSIAHLTKEKLEYLQIPVPLRKEQDDIVNVLSVWDQVIEKTERLIIENRINLGVLRHTLLTGKRRINGSGKKWKRYKLSDVLIEHGTLSTGREDVYSVSVHKGLVDQIEHLGRSFAAKDLSNYNLVNPGDVVYTKSPTGEFPYGIIKQSQVDSPVVVSPLYGVFTPRTWQLGAFLHHYFDSPVNTRNYLRPIIQKGAKNTINITNKTFLSGSLLLPSSNNETMKIVEILDAAQHEIDLLKKQADAYRRQKRGLMQKLLTGQWRVRTKDGG